MSGKILISNLLIIILLAGCKESNININYKNNPSPLFANEYIKLPLGTVKPDGWLKRQLTIQAEGLTGNLDDFWPEITNSAWRGGNGES